MIFDYVFQPPYIGYVPFEGIVLRERHLKDDKVSVDLNPLGKYEYTKFGVETIPAVHQALWLSAVLNSKSTLDFPPLEEWSRRLVGPSFLELVKNLNSEFTFCRFHLYHLPSWNSLRLAMAEGYTAMVGGSVYETFEKARNGSLVPMPERGTGLLGGHIFNLVSYDPVEDVATASANMGEAFGLNGWVRFRGAYIRNLGINRDFFLMTVD